MTLTAFLLHCIQAPRERLARADPVVVAERTGLPVETVRFNLEWSAGR